MSKAAVFLFAIMGGKFACAQYKPLDKGSSIQFKIKNFGFNVTGTFTGLSGSILFDPDRPADAAFDVSVDVNSVNTDNSMRDDHLRKFTYLDAKDYPRIRLLSTKITAAGKKGNFLFSGKLTIRNHTSDISFPFTADPSEGGYLFKGIFTINRKDFEVGGTSTISDNLEVSLGILAK
ncbi:MAG TPA: YceI family protein [Puia sp.]|nr:YceI family protein [Puia sp.]